MYELYPFSESNKNKKYTFYVLIILELEEDSSVSTQELANALTGYSTNEWIFNKYMEYYNDIIIHCKYITTVLENMTYGKFITTVRSEFNVKMSDAECITRFDIPLIDGELYMNTGLEEHYRDYECDFNDFEHKFMPSFFMMHELLSSGYINIDNTQIVCKMIEKILSVYIVLIKRMDIYGDDGDGWWFKSMPSDVKINITKKADFPQPIEQINYYDLVSNEYQMWYYINMITDYIGGPPDG